MNDWWHLPRTLPQNYLIAIFSMQPLSSVISPSAANDLLMKAESDHFLPERFLSHMIAVIGYIHKLATEINALQPSHPPEPSDESISLLTGEPEQDSYQSHRKERFNVALLQTSVIGLWMSLARIDGGGGYCLSHVIAKGYDVLRAWLCDMVVWNSHLLGIADRSINTIGTLQASIADIEAKLPSLVLVGCPITVDDVEFLLRGLKLLLGRSKMKVKLSDNIDISESGRLQADIGKVVPLNCGHNGWPAPLALAALTNSIRQCGFEIP